MNPGLLKSTHGKVQLKQCQWLEVYIWANYIPALAGKCSLHACCLRSPLQILLGLLIRSWGLLLNLMYSLICYMVEWSWVLLSIGIWSDKWWPVHRIMRATRSLEIALWWWVYCWWFWPAILNYVQAEVENNIHFLSACAHVKSVTYRFIEVSLFICRYNTLPSRRTLKNSRLVSKKDDVHVCIMCLRAIMNYQVCLCFWSLKKIWICQTPFLFFLGSLYFYLK